MRSLYFSSLVYIFGEHMVLILKLSYGTWNLLIVCEKIGAEW